MLDEVVEELAKLPEHEEVEEEEIINVAIIGRPNAGKSSLTNRLIGVDRSIVSDVAGTTRDAIDTVVEHDGKKYKIVDTAAYVPKARSTKMSNTTASFVRCVPSTALTCACS